MRKHACKEQVKNRRLGLVLTASGRRDQRDRRLDGMVRKEPRGTPCPAAVDYRYPIPKMVSMY
jgi:hypothetical protein